MWPNKKGYGSKIFWGPVLGPAKLVRRKIWVSRNLDFWHCSKIRGTISRIGVTYGIQLQNICSHGPNKKNWGHLLKNDQARAIFVQSGGIFWFLRFLKYCGFSWFLAVVFKFPPWAQLLGPRPNSFFICQIDIHFFGVHHCLGPYPIFWGPTMRISNLR